MDALWRDLADLRQTERKTQDLLEFVHGTLGHLVDRLAMIETDMRGKPAPPPNAALPPQPGSLAPPAPTLPKPRGVHGGCDTDNRCHASVYFRAGAACGG